MRRKPPILRIVAIIVVIAGVAAGVLYWRGIIGHSKETVAVAGKAPAAKATAKATHKPFVAPPDAPATNADNDPDTIDPFVTRLAKVNQMAHRMLVTNAEYHDSDAGDRYFVAIVTSCKALNALWPINKGVLAAKVEGPLSLKSDFATFSFVEYFQQGQWGVQSCEGVT